MNVVLGIGGHKNSGKDTVASMFSYINYVGIDKANYHDYAINKQKYDLTLCKTIVHFADVIKDNLSEIFNIPRNLFDDRDYKDNLWYDYRRNDFIENQWLTNEHHKLYIDDFTSLDSFKKLISDNPEFPCFKLRTLMQVYGQLMRDTFGNNIWVNSTIRRASKIALGNKLGLIADVRYTNEAIEIKSNNFSTGYVVRIYNKKVDSIVNDNHPSERIIYKEDFSINNDSTLISLFYQCFTIYKKINK